GRASGTAWRRRGSGGCRGVRGAAAAAVLDRLPDPRQRQRGRGRGPGDLAALPRERHGADLAEVLPVGGGDPAVDRRAAVGAGATGVVRRTGAAPAAAPLTPTQ